MLVAVDLRSGSSEIRGAEDLRSLAVEVHGDGSGADIDRALAGLGTVDGDHVWLDVAALRRRAAAHEGTDWAQRYDEMIRYAESKGWTDDDASRVRAHVAHVSS